MKPKKKPKILSNPPIPVYVTALPIPLLINNIINITTINKHTPRVISKTYSLSIILSTYGFVLGNKISVITYASSHLEADNILKTNRFL